MKRWGRLRFRDVEGGTWVLETRDGPVVLIGSVPDHLDGADVEVEGSELDGVGITMAGPQFEVRGIWRR